jgi:hypothetical protein
VGVEELEKLQPNFARPAEGAYNELAAARASSSRRRRRRRAIGPPRMLWNLVMRHSLSPLLFRLLVLVTSVVALGVDARIYHLETRQGGEGSSSSSSSTTAGRAQSLVALAVDCIAIPYIGYMIRDEYTGKPLGLRSAVSKMSLILLDLFFIIFKSAGTALAFESLLRHNLADPAVRELAKALASFMLIGLLAWTMTFTVNIFRTVWRLGGGEDETP